MFKELNRLTTFISYDISTVAATNASQTEKTRRFNIKSEHYFKEVILRHIFLAFLYAMWLVLNRLIIHAI